MNKRLKQIMLEHGLHKHISEDCQHRMEMLYELVVRECCDIFVELRTRPADLAVKDVKKHFGIEE